MLAKVLGTIPKLVLGEDNKMLMKAFFEEEIKKIIFQLHCNKALGLDGFPIGFF